MIRKVTLILACFCSIQIQAQTTNKMSNKARIVIHGGAGTILKKNMTPEKEANYHAKLKEAIMAGKKALDKGESAENAVVECIKIMENSPLFNAGKGAVFTHEETIEMDASIMEGSQLNAGAACSISHIKNPITLALAIMNNSQHVMLCGKGADDFGKSQKLEIADNDYFKDSIRYRQLKKVQEMEEAILDHDGDQGGVVDSSETEFNITLGEDKKFGTVGAVVRDDNNHLAAGTSTGGMTNKRFGRVGDSPIIGAGTYANDSTCAISCTGHGEYFIRHAVAYNVHSRMYLKEETLEDASEFVINQELVQVEGKGGLIGIDNDGNYAMPFNTKGMFRAVLYEDGRIETMMYDKE